MNLSDGMLSVSEAQNTILERLQICGHERAPLLDALGRVLARQIVAGVELPPFDNSSMDGFAVRAADVAGASRAAPVGLDLVADIAAGHPASVEIGPGQAARIMTGAPMPAGADAVVPKEVTDEPAAGWERLPARVLILEPSQPGQYVRLAGTDVRRGQTVLQAGVVVRPAQVALLAALGLAQVTVFRRPRVAVLATGDELVAPGQPLPPGAIYDANGASVAAQVLRYGGELIQLGVARDSADDLRQKLGQGVEAGADLIVASAGVSVGAYDLVRRVVAAEGELNFWRVRMRPGKPLAFGQFRGAPFFGLPGNPVSALLTFEQFVRPALRKMAGHAQWAKPAVRAVLAEPVTSDGRETYARAWVERQGEGYVARLSGGQGSNVLSALVAANALVIIPEGQSGAAAGTLVWAQMIDWPETVF